MWMAILFMLQAYEDQPDSWIGQAMSGIMNFLTEVLAGDYLRETTLEDMLLKTPEEELNSFEKMVSGVVEKGFEKRLMEALGLEDKEALKQLLSQGEALNQALKDAGLDTSAYSIQDLREMSPEELRTKVFTPDVIQKLAQNEQFAPIVGELALKNNETLRALMPESMRPILNDHNANLIREEFSKIPEAQRKAAFQQFGAAMTSGNIFSGALIAQQLNGSVKDGTIQDITLNILKGLDVTPLEGRTIKFPMNGTLVDVDIASAVTNANALLSEHNQAVMESLNGTIDKEAFEKISHLIQSVTRGQTPDLNELAMLAQDEQILAAIKKLTDPKTGLQIPADLSLSYSANGKTESLEIGKTANQAFAFLRAGNNIEILQKTAPAFAAHPELVNQLQTALNDSENPFSTKIAMDVVNQYMENSELSKMEKAGLLYDLYPLRNLDTSMLAPPSEEASLDEQKETDQVSFGDFIPNISLPFFNRGEITAVHP